MGFKPLATGMNREQVIDTTTHLLRPLPADVARCNGARPNGECLLRETCLRFRSPPHERQVWMMAPGGPLDQCSDFVRI